MPADYQRRADPRPPTRLRPMPPARTLHINVNALSQGYHPGGWRRDDVDPRAVFTPEYHLALARAAERGTLDAIFYADNPRLGSEAHLRPPFSPIDPLLVLSRLAGETEHVGLVATVSTTYSDPYSVARRMATLDLISDGRAGWNAVTTFDPGTGANFGGVPLPPREARYARADEFIRVVRGLWSGWDPDAIVADRRTGEYLLHERVRPLDHSGDHFRVAGPLSTPPGPQVHPVIFQAGGSDPGRELAARHADAVFSAAVDPDTARQHRSDLRRRAVSFGRDPDSILLLPGLLTVIGSTEQEAQRRLAELDRLAGDGPLISHLAHRMGVAPTVLSADEPVPADVFEAAERGGTMAQGFLTTLAPLVRRGLTVREIVAETGDGNGHRAVVGSPEQIADSITSWFESGAADGFNITPDVLPDGLDAFVDHVVPILRQRGVFRHEYSGRTLREHYGLAPVEPL